ncbi:hypothetical protein Ddc_16486 [Ditylenchus destructor]|nr:hypothetical protein Ddc_16486 [Ditylenchus destructor]
MKVFLSIAVFAAVALVLSQAAPSPTPGQVSLVSLIQALIKAVQELLAVPSIGGGNASGAGNSTASPGGSNVTSLVTLIQSIITALQALLVVPGDDSPTSIVQATLVTLVQALIRAVQALLAVPGVANGNGGGAGVSSLVSLIQTLITAIQELLKIPDVGSSLPSAPVSAVTGILGSLPLVGNLGGTVGNLLGGLGR